MARITVSLKTEFRPAFHALYAVAEEIARTHGEEAALYWVSKILDQDFDMFCTVSAEDRPELRLIQGGR